MAAVTKISIDGTEYNIDDVSAVDYSEVQSLTDEQKGQARENIGAWDSVYSLLLNEEIPNTVQSISFDSSGNISSITHASGNTTIRTDAFTFGTGTITEVRTLNTGESLTFVTNLTTLQTTVTYEAA